MFELFKQQSWINFQESNKILPNEINFGEKLFLKLNAYSENVILSPLLANSALTTTGLRRIFQNERANLNGISDDREMLFLDQAKQLAVIEPNDLGLRASKSDNYSVNRKSVLPLALKIENLPELRRQAPSMNVKRPFLFLIRYQNLTLLIGQVVNI